MISRTAEYAMLAMATLARHQPDDRISAIVLAKETGIPQNYLSTILHTLGRANLAEGVRGPGGGFRLARAAKQITAYEVVSLFDDLTIQGRCLLGLRDCCPEDRCHAHADWMKVWERYERFLQRTTLDRLVKRAVSERKSSRTPKKAARTKRTRRLVI
jgi:Rrf2 family iron-sulfur cluster assembly transcriptional regulator